MPVVTVASFAAFANLVVAGCKLTAAGSPVDLLKSLADVATGTKSLDAALGTSGLAAVAAEMTRTAEAHARHFTHPGRARDDAIALFWQVAPSAFADPATFAAAHLDPKLTADRMVAAIQAGPHARDFRETALAETFFRGVSEATLKVMFARADTVAALAPALWRQALANDAAILATTAVTREDTAEILALVRDLHAMKATSVPEATLIAMARKISPHVADRDEALGALDAAADRAAEAQARGETGSNVDGFVDATLRRLAALTAEGELDTAADAADAAVEAAEAGLAQLFDAAIRQHLLAFDAEAAARQIVRRLRLDGSADGLFEALRGEQGVWYALGRDGGQRLDLDVSIALARASVEEARDPDQSGFAFNDLGNALQTLGAREAGTARLEEAVAAYHAALEVRTRDRVPLDWAMSQMNLASALQTLGERAIGTERLEEAVAAYRAALEELTRERAPLDWAMAQMNLGTALATLGHREGDTARLEAAVAAYRAALEERNRELVPLGWATTQMNLGNALHALGARESGTARLEEAVAAYRAALEERTRDRVPLDWAMTQANLAGALATLGMREAGTARLEEAVDAYAAVLAEQTRDRLPLDWANTTGNQGAVLLVWAERTADPALARRALAQLAEGEAALRAGGHAPFAVTFARQLPAAEALVARLSGDLPR